MAFVLKDRVKETSTTTGTGTFTLGGASFGYQGFSTVGNANTTFYSIVMGSEWENGIGTYTSSGSTLSRDTVLSSSNSGNLVNFSSGTKDVFINYPAGRAVAYDTPSQSTGAFHVTVGTTAQRPSSPATGMIRYNTTESQYEVYSGSEWKYFSQAVYSYSVSYLVVAGGGGGGNNSSAAAGGGGGAGGFRTGTGLSVTPGTSYTITVGAGGASQVNGGNSIFSTITSTGGGKGGTYSTGPSASSGGSGGGGNGSNIGDNIAGSGNTPVVSPSQGSNGGNGFNNSDFSAGGGGGASATGVDATTNTGGNGGNGTASSISGSSVTYAGGGGGGRGGNNSGGGGTGGTGGGGAGGAQASGSNGTTSLGGGGGGGAGSGAYTGGAGGSGVVIISYAGAQRGTGGTVTSSGGNTIHTFTSSGTYTA